MWLIERIIDFVLSPFRWIGSLVWRLTRPRMPTLIIDDQGFSLCKRGVVIERYRWDEIGRIVGFKLDQFTCDEICLQIDIGRRVGPLVLSEDFEGFDQFVKMMEKNLPAVTENWWGQVAFPPFAENDVTIFQRT